MGSKAAPRQGQTAGAPIVAFDFDGTLTWTDSFLAFLAWRSGPARHALGMVRMAPAALAYAWRRDRTALKAALVREYLLGAALPDLDRQARAFAEQASPRLLRCDAVRCWEDWRDRGARLVIVTASPEFVVAPFAQALRAERLIGTRLALDAESRVTGAFDGLNCRGPEKVVRLRAAFGADVRLAAAYGDTDGDTAMLALAEVKGMRVFGDRP